MIHALPRSPALHDPHNASHRDSDKLYDGLQARSRVDLAVGRPLPEKPREARLRPSNGHSRELPERAGVGVGDLLGQIGREVPR